MNNFDQTTPLVSVCIANYNGATIIADCITSVLTQKGGFPVEIIVHDDASTDASVEIIRRDFPQVRLLENNRNVGFCISNNRMAASARGEYLLLLNNDAALLPGALSAFIQHTRSHAPGILTLPQYDWETGKLVDRGCMLDPFYNPVPNYDPSQTDVAMVIGACLWIPRQMWEELGGFPEWFESIAEDMYICCKARLCGHAVQAVPESGYRHRQGKSFGGNRVDSGKLASTFRRRRLSERNKTFVMITCTPASLLTILLPLHLLALAIEGILLSIMKLDWRIWREIYVNVFFSVIRLHHQLARFRNENMTQRSGSTRSYSRSFVPLPHKLCMIMKYGMPKIE